MPKRKDKSAAIITIKSPGKMTPEGRKDIAMWLRQHAAHLLRHGKDYTDGRFTGRFMYR